MSPRLDIDSGYKTVVLSVALLPAFTQRIGIHTAVLVFNLYIVLFNDFGFDPASDGLII
jgi:uncharacterized membrane protein